MNKILVQNFRKIGSHLDIFSALLRKLDDLIFLSGYPVIAVAILCYYGCRVISLEIGPRQLY